MVKNLAKSLLPAQVWTRLRLLRLRRSVAAFQARNVQHVYGGVPLTIHLADPLGQGWYDRDWPVLPEIALLRQHQLKPGARVFDLGAHQCVVALMLADAVGPAGAVIALEANAHNAAVAQRNKELNHAAQLQILHAAAAETSGQLTFNEGLNGAVDDGTGSWGQVSVVAWSVDELAQKYGPPDALFIDVEGYECHVLRGARETLRRGPDCFVEVHIGCGLEQFGGSLETVLAFFPAARYKLLMASDAAPEFVPLDVSSALARERFFLLALRNH
jgi:FkbM family methyltransferase